MTSEINKFFLETLEKILRWKRHNFLPGGVLKMLCTSWELQKEKENNSDRALTKTLIFKMLYFIRFADGKRKEKNCQSLLLSKDLI